MRQSLLQTTTNIPSGRAARFYVCTLLLPKESREQEQADKKLY
jgi:hypothetical protein